MKELIPLFLSTVKDWPWKKIVATAISVAIIVYALSLISCSVSRKIETYGVTEKNYVSYDTIRVTASKKIPKNFVYEP